MEVPSLNVKVQDQKEKKDLQALMGMEGLVLDIKVQHSQGNLIKPETKQLSARFEIAEDSCKLRFSSTDYLPIVESASKLLKLLDSSLVTCKKEPNYMAILKGTTGLNGRIKIEVSSNPSPS
ncbi:uncharacterized protein PGTG_02651 [Puccinia graminis f. sp. tritici CRL 75-36-700-3]|uniref:Uncharacterized protein n=1 Tax=Puccinia graminis f. sp. tritici (strain CRL 75-36-700-3 / race SCCL) TaxID=418459 RepID=E3JVY5_PUCGT|nr:uncharacterized protein PGTG_02651 [Puccinia graminis f. sp. tritici CRL 75-36-700-3]EFP76210.1 hypothetical protein PGTG_02651 [Puccinia graminis f. sp. tritici CRL 75-36-700-3]